jgi:hypothetical protein
MNRQKDFPPEEDDGRTIADMNVEGLPWYQPEHPALRRSSRSQSGEIPSWRETFSMIAGAWKASLLLTVIYAAVLVAVVFFLIWIWT